LTKKEKVLYIGKNLQKKKKKKERKKEKSYITDGYSIWRRYLLTSRRVVWIIISNIQQVAMAEALKKGSTEVWRYRDLYFSFRISS
jgi:post-segregation antitoxin (ccd killing protein)